MPRISKNEALAKFAKKNQKMEELDRVMDLMASDKTLSASAAISATNATNVKETDIWNHTRRRKEDQAEDGKVVQSKSQSTLLYPVEEDDLVNWVVSKHRNGDSPLRPELSQQVVSILTNRHRVNREINATLWSDVKLPPPTAVELKCIANGKVTDEWIISFYARNADQIEEGNVSNQDTRRMLCSVTFLENTDCITPYRLWIY
jgi:flagellar biosynthesis/type III secretory pathway ATPase